MERAAASLHFCFQAAGAAPTHKLYRLDVPPNKAATGESTLLGRDKKPDRIREVEETCQGIEVSKNKRPAFLQGVHSYEELNLIYNLLCQSHYVQHVNGSISIEIVFLVRNRVWGAHHIPC